MVVGGKPIIIDPSVVSRNTIPYSYKFSRDVYFADATNSAFSRFYLQDFVLVDYVRTIIKYKFSRT